MTVLDTAPSIQISDKEVEAFQRDGFLIISKPVISEDRIQQLRDRVHAIFEGDFDTGIYPDEWHWRQGMSREDVTREICNAWKSDSTIAKWVLSQELGQACARLGGWPGARVGQDDIWIKPPGVGCKEIAFHTDAPYISKWFLPNEDSMVTAWLALDDTSEETGTLQYVPGSHRWNKQMELGEFHAPDQDFRSPLQEASRAAGVDEVEIVHVNVPAGGIAFHHQDLWHGSGMNRSSTQFRRNIAVHMLRSDVEWGSTKTGYIYGRYRRQGEFAVDENFFPIVWSENRYRTNLEG
jgi:ectoine hydroxylase-related dioxygenase (phytanoyl-CoA dioxygenase family)